LSQYKLPENDDKFNSLEKLNKTIKNPFVNRKNDKGIISVRMKDIGRLKVKKILEELNHWISFNIKDPTFELRVAGRHSLIDKTNQLMINSLFDGLLIALGLISIIIGLLFKSFKMAIISLVPNLLPLIFTAGAMGIIGVELNASSAIIFTIAFVIAIDDTIHFLKKYAFLKKQNETIDKEEQIKQTIVEAGKAIMITSIILISGYGILLFSDFKEAYYHGFLICLTMAWALLADLFLLPILLRKFT